MQRAAMRVVMPLILALAASAGAQEQGLPPGAKSTVLDLIFKVEDIRGKADALTVQETDTEVRIELAADVLFDFDKSTLQAQAQETLTKAAAFIRERAVQT